MGKAEAGPERGDQRWDREWERGGQRCDREWERGGQRCDREWEGRGQRCDREWEKERWKWMESERKVKAGRKRKREVKKDERFCLVAKNGRREVYVVKMENLRR